MAAVFPEPTRARAPLLDRIAARPEVDLTAIHCGPGAAGRELRHRAVVLRGLRVPGLRRALASVAPDVVVVSGWRALAAQAAIAWCRLARVPYVLVVEEAGEDGGGWRRAVHGAVVGASVEHAGGVLVTGTLTRRAVLQRGAASERVRVFTEPIDVEAFGADADRHARRRSELRGALGADPDDVVVLSSGPLAPEKRHADLVHALAGAGSDRLMLVLAGAGEEHEHLDDLARVRGVRLAVTDDAREPIELYAAADVFALLSERETWATVVNEAAACGLPLVLSDGVGAAHDLLVDGENGVLVEVGDVSEAAAALRRLAEDTELRAAFGARSRERAQDWGYGPSVEGFVAAVREAVSDTGRR